MIRRPRLATLSLFCVLAAPSALAASLSLQKGPLILGTDKEVGVTLRVEEAPGTEELPLLLEVNVGRFGPVTRTAPGVFKTTYFLPETEFPQVALVAAWRETGPDAPIDFLRIPLYGITYVPVRARPGAEVSVQVGLDPTPPVTVGKSGLVEVEVAVPPGIAQAAITLRPKKNGPVTTRQVPIEVPPYNRLTAALVPQAILADGESWARLELFYDAPGQVLDERAIKVQASVGAAQFQEAQGGRYVYRYQPPADTAQPDVKFALSLQADPVANAKAHLSLRLPPPARVTVRPPETKLIADGKGTGEVVVQVLAESGLALPRQRVTLTANGTSVAAPPKYLGKGRYGFAYPAPARYPPKGQVIFRAELADAPALRGEAPYQLEPAPVPATVSARFHPARVPSDGRTPAEVTFDVRDAAGRPLNGAQLSLDVAAGKISDLREVGDGLYRAQFVPPAQAPEQEATMRVRDASGQYDQALPLPLRVDPRHLLFGVRAGATHGLGQLFGPRAGLDLLIPIRFAGGYLLAGVSAMGGMASSEITDASSGFSSRSEAMFAPLSARLGYELFAGRNLNLQVGAGGVFTVARFTTSLTGEVRHGSAFGGMGFVGMGYAVGPGQFFTDVSYVFAPVTAGDFSLQAGGVGLELGYRFTLH